MRPALDHMRVTLSAFALAGPIAFLSLATGPSRAQTRDERNADFKDDYAIIFPKDGDKLIIFGDKSFIDTQVSVLVRGTLTGSWVQYPNNTYSIFCVPAQCIVASVRQIGDNQVGRIDVSPYAVTEWSDNEIIARDDQLCMRSTITIDRRAQSLLLVDVPINQVTTTCKAFVPIKPRTATIGEPPFWKSWPRK